jgi:Cu2+-containing amine oxidase
LSLPFFQKKKSNGSNLDEISKKKTKTWTFSKMALVPLTVEEIERAGRLVKDHFNVPSSMSDAHMFMKLRLISISFLEPSKHKLSHAQRTGERRAQAIALVRDEVNKQWETYIIVVLVSPDRLAKITFVEHAGAQVQPAIVLEEAEHAEKLVRENKEFCDEMYARGHTDPSRWMVEPWSAGNFNDSHADALGHRLIHGLVWVRIGSDYDNGYAHPIEGLAPIIDLSTDTVIVRKSGRLPAPATPLAPGNFYHRDELDVCAVMASTGKECECCTHKKRIKEENEKDKKNDKQQCCGSSSSSCSSSSSSSCSSGCCSDSNDTEHDCASKASSCPCCAAKLAPKRSVKPDLTREIRITQPHGASFQVANKYEVDWQNWQFNVGFTAREGLVLRDIRFDGRPVIWRASLSEMVVPYFAPHWPHYRKNAFDSGEYGIGTLANSLALGCDCLGEIHYFDGVLSTINGGARTIKNAVCMHEEDWGLLWKHSDWRLEASGHSVAVQRARSTRLVVSFWTTVGNYGMPTNRERRLRSS